MGIGRYLRRRLDLLFAKLADKYISENREKFSEYVTHDMENSLSKMTLEEVLMMLRMDNRAMARFILESMMYVDEDDIFTIPEHSNPDVIYRPGRHVLDATFDRLHYFLSIPKQEDLTGNWFRKTAYSVLPELQDIYIHSTHNSVISTKAKVQEPCTIIDSSIDDYTYGAFCGHISMTTIGKFCSIGPHLLCGWGIHPIDGISTSPMFYSTKKQNGTTLSETDKVEERKPITIGNDVFIGANVTILDGVTIGDGAVIGAGAVVSKDIPPYAIAVGCPIKIVKYRFSEGIIKRLQKIKWWEFDEEKLARVEKYFFDIESFLKICEYELQ